MRWLDPAVLMSLGIVNGIRFHNHSERRPRCHVFIDRETDVEHARQRRNGVLFRIGYSLTLSATRFRT